MKKKKFSVGLLFVYLVLVIWALTTIYPLIWVVMNSFKDKKQIVSNSFSFPVGALFTLDNYEKAINKFSIFTAYRNSLLISCTVAAVWLSCLQGLPPMRWSAINSKAAD